MITKFILVSAPPGKNQDWFDNLKVARLKAQVWYTYGPRNTIKYEKVYKCFNELYLYQSAKFMYKKELITTSSVRSGDTLIVYIVFGKKIK